MKKIFFLGLLLGWIILPLSAQTKIEYKEFTLDNGLHVIMHQDNTTPIVATFVLYHVGSKNENPERTGFANFIMRLMVLEGSENIDRGQYMNIIQSRGGQSYGASDYDNTYFFDLLPSNELDLALYMESERMLHTKVDLTGVETQREKVKEEFRLLENQPYGNLLSETLKRAYTTHPYQWEVRGSMDHLNAATIEEFQQFYKDFYVPNNATLTIAGDIDYATTEAMVRKYFSEIPRGTNPVYRPEITEPKRTDEVRDDIYKNIQIQSVVQAYNLPRRNHPDSYAVSMLSTYLTGGSSSLMTKELVDRQQKALNVVSIPLELEDGGLFLMLLDANTGVKARDLESEVNWLIKQVQDEGIPDDEFTKLKNIKENDIVSKNSTMLGIAQNLAEAKVIFKNTEYINQVMEAYAKVTKEDIQRVAKTYLDRTGRVVLNYLPKSAEPAVE
jgi:predicted Zn-dependent peptidase